MFGASDKTTGRIWNSSFGSSALSLVSLVAIATAFKPAEVPAQEPAATRPPTGISAKAPEVPTQDGVLPKKPRKIAHGGCYYPFPIPANEPDEPMARQFLADRGAEYLDNLTRQWTRDAGCVTCHTTLSYSLCRPAMVNVP